MAREDVLFKICVIWMLVTVHGVSSILRPPSIAPSEELTVNVDEKIKLECQSPDGPVSWEHPPDYEDVKDDNGSYAYRIKTEKLGNIYYATMTVEKAQYFHTGYYTCSYNSDDSESDVSSRIYVYAFDENNLIVQSDDYENPIDVIPDKETVVPCRPTSPKVQMTLFDSLENELVVDGNEISYNPRIGFTLLHPQVAFPTVECRARLGNAECENCKLSFTIHVRKPTGTPVAKPKIEGDRHADVNHMFTLTCVVYYEGNVALDIKWLDPNGEVVSNNTNNRIFVGSFEKRIQNDLEDAVLTMTVRSASKADEGTYRCEAQNGRGSSNFDEFYVKILDEGEAFIDLYVQGNKSTIQARDGTDNSVQWIVDIHAHPRPTVKWSDFNGLVIPAINGTGMCDSQPSSPHRYWSTSTDTKTKLTICHPRVADTGHFTLEVANSDYSRKQIKVFLNVSGAPEVILRPFNRFQGYGESIKLSCTVSSNPKSRIHWMFHECSFRSNEDCFLRVPEELVDTYEIEEKDTVVHSELTLRALRTGLVTCKACNRNVSSNEDICSNQSGELIVSDVNDGFGVNSPDLIVEGEEQVNVSCLASVNFYNDTLRWTQIPSNKPAETIRGVSIFFRNTPFSFVADMVIDRAMLSHSGTYQCGAERLDGYTDYKNVTLSVLPMTRPEIRESSFNQTKKIEIPVGFQFLLFCKAQGLPEPEIRWYKDNLPIKPTDDKRIKLNDKGTRLFVSKTVASDEGQYECRAVNRAGIDRQSVTIVLSNDLSKYVYIGIVALALTLIAVIVYLVIRIKKEKKQRKRLMEAGLLDFEKGAVENLDPHLPVDEQAERLPYDPDFEFPRNKLKLGKILGSGAFGVVLKGDAYGILREDEVTPVAVKMVKKNADGSILRALTSELKILIHLGRHLNVVNLLGACTKCINKMELLVIVEYCRYGNLQNYLLRHRKAFINQVDQNTGQIDYSIKRGHPGDRSSSQSNSMGDDMKDYRSDYGENLMSGATDVTTISMTPTGHEESSLMSNNSNQPEWRSNYTGDYKDNVEPITTEDLVCFAFQVARGMDYLASRKVLHGDLAARNILLADNKVVKICDFGLARTMYKDETYRKKENGPLPIKWMAIESLRDRIFSTQSDVWSFGIVLWEFFTLSRTPYPGTQPNQTFLERLEEGYRMEKPPYSPEEVYELMMSCWRARPTLRPSFAELADKLGALLNEDVRNLYIEMNRPYIEKNVAWMEGTGRQDYLAMINAPVYDNMTSPLPVDDDPRISSPIPRTPGVAGSPLTLQDGYVVMRSPSNQTDPRNIFSPTRMSGSNGGSVFKFGPPPKTLQSPDEEHVELRPMLSGGSQRSESANESDTDAYLEPRNNRPVHPSNKFSSYSGETVVDSLSNPSYLMAPSLAPSLNTSKDNYINYPQTIGSKQGSHLWPRNRHDQQKSSPVSGRPDQVRPVHLDLDQDVKLPPSYINIPSQRRGFALPNNDEVTYANLR